MADGVNVRFDPTFTTRLHYAASAGGGNRGCENYCDTWGYPVVPAIFVVAYVFLLGSMFYSNRGESLAGLLLIVFGFAAWRLFGLADKNGARKTS